MKILQNILFSVVMILSCCFLTVNTNIAKADCTATIDVVFYIDTSGSMSTEWSTVCTSIASITAGITAAGNTVNYKVYGLEASPGCATGAIMTGSDENWGPATSWVANNYAWTPGAIRIAVPMSDECPYYGGTNATSCNVADTNSITQAINDATANNVIVSPIISTGGTAYVHGTNLANGTGGTISNASIAADIITAITELITNEIGDTDGDGYLSAECGGDDCNDSSSSVFPGGACTNKCFGNVIKSGICQIGGSGQCVYDTEVAVCEGMGNQCITDICQEIYGGDDVCVPDAGGGDICGGLIPCGREVDDPTTPTIFEDTACNACSLILTMQLVIEYLIKISVIFATLMIVAGGLFYVFAGGKSEVTNKAKAFIKYALIGFVIIFIAWAIIDSILMTLGYIDPLAGDWYTVC